MIKKGILLITFCLFVQSSFAYDWTYIARVGNNSGGALKTFYLWLPPKAEGVRGVIMSSVGRITQLSGDSTIRKACKESDIGIMGCLNLDGNFAVADTQYINNALAEFALQSKLPELNNIPLASYGTSVGGIFAWEVAYAYPGRFFAIIQDNSVYTKPPAWASAGSNLAEVPLILSRGYLEPVGDKPWLSKDSVLKQRSLGGKANMILAAGLGHFSWTNWEANYLAKWIKKAATARIPQGEYARISKPVLFTIPQETGWLTDTNFTSSPIVSASYSAYSGDKEKALWHFDEEMATLWINMHQGQFTKTVQQGQYNNSQLDNCPNPPWQQCSPTLVIADYTLLNPNAVTNAGLPVRYGVYNGPFRNEPNNNISLDPTLIDESTKGWVVAIQEGDATHQGWERAVQLLVAKKTNGTNQTITISPIADQTDTSAFVLLNPTSTSGLSVVSRVKSGPAEIIGNQLHFRPFAGDLGARAAVIIRYGQSGNATFNTAGLRTDTIWVTKTIVGVSKKMKADKNFFYPNPGKSNVFWKGSEAPLLLTVSDMQGCILRNERAKSPANRYDFYDLPKGSYLIRYQTKSEVGTFIWIKE